MTYTGQTYPSYAAYLSGAQVSVFLTGGLEAWMGGFYQWGRNNDESDTGFLGNPYKDDLVNNFTHNDDFYQGDMTYGEWYGPDMGIQATDRWVANNQ